ncbi:Ribosomal RNA small subunit methyltransferase G [compost metagenome]
MLNEFCLPFTKVGGLFIAMKGQDVADELDESGRSLKELWGRWVETHEFELPIEQSKRHMVVIRKTAPTPRIYPRKAGTPLKNPIV